MAMAATNSKGLHGSGGGSRGRPYGLMLLLAFGTALLGVMVLHKLRERRIYNMLVKERDRQLITLNLLLQKEKDYVKEVKRKNDEMKAKLASLGTQKMELDRRVMEMQSTVDSLKDEQSVMESAFEEKQNEMKMLRDKETDMGTENPELIALTERLVQKEAEIQELKHRLELVEERRENIGGTSKLSRNSSSNENMAGEDKAEIRESEEKDEQTHESTKDGDGENVPFKDPSRSKLSDSEGSEETERDEEDETDRRVENTERRGLTDENFQVKDGNSGGAAGEEEKAAHEIRQVVDSEEEGDDTYGKDTVQKAVDPKDNEMEGDGQVGKLKDAQGFGGQGYNVKHHKSQPKQGRANRSKGKRWKAIMKNRLVVANAEGAEDVNHGGLHTRQSWTGRQMKKAENNAEQGNEGGDKYAIKTDEFFKDLDTENEDDGEIKESKSQQDKSCL